MTLNTSSGFEADARCECSPTQDCINEDTEQRPSMRQIVERLLAAEGLPADAAVEEKVQQAHIPAAMFDSANSL